MIRKSIAIIGFVVIATAGTPGLFTQTGMAANDTVIAKDIILSVGTTVPSTAVSAQENLILTAVAATETGNATSLIIDYPPDNAVFPLEMTPPLFSWHDTAGDADTWVVDISFDGTEKHIYALTSGVPLPELNIDPDCISPTNELPAYTDYETSGTNWMPPDNVWDVIKTLSTEQSATVTVYGFASDTPGRILSKGSIDLTTSTDPVDAMLFYRDVPLMPSVAEGGKVKPLSDDAIKLIKWRLRDIARTDSRVVLTDVPTCVNCHSFSNDGATLGMDVDGPQSDKGSYTVASIEPHMVIGHEDIISWNHLFADKPAGQSTIGFLSQVSPDGLYAVTTLNEAMYVENYLSYEFLQVFYPTRGILGYWSEESGKVLALPGADDPAYVHCDPVWSPDGSYLVFARAVAKNPYGIGQEPAPYADSPEETPMRYDLYRIPFNDGRGGTPELIAGASDNGMSNCFPKITPDGRFIVFVKCRNGQLMRPDSRLWIVPVEGGEAREMACNTDLMNSWHTISPNGRWMVFSSKSRSPYTQLFITHLDENGNDSPPLLIPGSTAANRAANIPEFVAIGYDDLIDITITGMAYERTLNSARVLYNSGRLDEAMTVLDSLLANSPNDPKISAEIIECMGDAYFVNGSFDNATKKFEEAVAIDPTCTSAINNHGLLLEKLGQTGDAIDLYRHTLDINPNNITALFQLATLRRTTFDTEYRNIDEAIALAEHACISSNYRDPGIMALLAESYAAAGKFDLALENGAFALDLFRIQGLEQVANDFEKRMVVFREKAASAGN